MLVLVLCRIRPCFCLIIFQGSDVSNVLMKCWFPVDSQRIASLFNFRWYFSLWRSANAWDTRSAPNKHLHLLIQRGRILVPKITWDEGQIIVALICEKLSIKHIWSDYHAVICTRLLNAPCTCFLSPSLPFIKQWLCSSSPCFINSDMRISPFVTQTWKAVWLFCVLRIGHL